tara:strand:- start:247 stop:561 length:315 start_codon:yes stop_codon:yes gene_type:complete
MTGYNNEMIKLLPEFSNDFVEDSLSGLSERMKVGKLKLKELTIDRRIQMFELKKRGYTYKQIAKFANCSTSFCFKEILRAERLYKKYASEIANSKVTGSHPTPT